MYSKLSSKYNTEKRATFENGCLLSGVLAFCHPHAKICELFWHSVWRILASNMHARRQYVTRPL